MVSQLRVYTINRDKLDEFVKGWTEHIYPLRLKFGFTVDGAWTIRERNEFIWILSYNGDEDWATKEATYHNSPERLAIDPNPGRLVAYALKQFIDPVKLGE